MSFPKVGDLAMGPVDKDLNLEVVSEGEANQRNLKKERGPCGRERELARQLMAKLREHPGVWVMKIHGSAYQLVGVPDLAVIAYGVPYYLELKTKRGLVSEIQKQRMKELYVAGARVAVIRSVKEGLAFVGVGVSDDVIEEYEKINSGRAIYGVVMRKAEIDHLHDLRLHNLSQCRVNDFFVTNARYMTAFHPKKIETPLVSRRRDMPLVHVSSGEKKWMTAGARYAGRRCRMHCVEDNGEKYLLSPIYIKAPRPDRFAKLMLTMRSKYPFPKMEVGDMFVVTTAGPLPRNPNERQKALKKVRRAIMSRLYTYKKERAAISSSPVGEYKAHIMVDGVYVWRVN